jgi:hypothetical protein
MQWSKAVPRSPATLVAGECHLNTCRQAVWFPPGEWFDFFTGERFSGPNWRVQYYGLDDIPLYARAGAILPLQTETTQNGCSNPNKIDVLVFPGKDGVFELYEDDGTSQEYLKNGGCNTRYTSHWTETSLSFRVSPAVGELESVPLQRVYQILFRGVDRPEGVTTTLNGTGLTPPFCYDASTRTAAVGPIEVRFDQSLSVEIYTNFPYLSPFDAQGLQNTKNRV